MRMPTEQTSAVGRLSAVRPIWGVERLHRTQDRLLEARLRKDTAESIRVAIEIARLIELPQ